VTNGEEREGRPGDRKKGRRGGVASRCRLQESSSSTREAGGGEVDVQGASTQQLPELNDEDKATFAKIPLAFGVFWKL
jgi:hypothetical protein